MGSDADAADTGLVVLAEKVVSSLPNLQPDIRYLPSTMRKARENLPQEVLDEIQGLPFEERRKLIGFLSGHEKVIKYIQLFNSSRGPNEPYQQR